MRITPFIFTILLTGQFLTGIAQENKYQGLLWEITGNELSEPSYLYGTMHVSDKLAFNVSDAFYKCLSEVDAICLESSPATWMEEYREMGTLGSSAFNYNFGVDFYRDAFSISTPGTQEVYSLLENKNSMMNQILYRYKPGAEDYEENTYLDMFIYQAGAKYDKPVYSLEDLSDVIELSILAMTPDKEKKNDNSNNSYLENNEQMKFALLEEAYRRGDLDKIDSLSKSNTPTEVYHKYFIVERNRNMVQRMDSLMQSQSVFTGIGAAHLPGNEGTIELLRELGYTVEPISRKTTKKSHKLRKKLIGHYKPVEFKNQVVGDEFVEVAVPGELFEMPTNIRGRMEYLSPEPINGGYFSIIRLFTYGPLFDKEPGFYKSTFDSLLYIATPGEMIKKEDIEANGHEGYNILTRTSKNDIVNYKVFFTPTEVIIFKGSGNDKYIERKEPQTFFNELKLKAPTSEWTEISSRFGGASWKMKGLVTAQDMIREMDETKVHPCYQSYDSESGDYFLVMRYDYNDLNYIEEDSFDLAFLGETFANQIGYEVDVSTEVNIGHRLSIEQYLKKKDDGKGTNPRTKLIANAGGYYLMVAVAGEENTRAFFDSFQFQDFQPKDEYEPFTDSSLYFSVNTVQKDDSYDYTQLALSLYQNSQDEKEDKSFLSDTKNQTYSNSKTSESVYVGYIKFHDYDEALSEEDFWEYRTKKLDDENYFIVSREEKKDLENGDKTYSFLLTDTGSTRGIMTKFHLHEGVFYTLQSLIDTVEGPTKYVSTFFDSFTPLDTAIGRTVFEDKAALFFENALSEDSLTRANAIKSIGQIDFEREEIPEIINVYENFEYSEENETDEREDIIMAMGDLKSDTAYTFLRKTFEENNFDSDIQFIVMKCFSYTESQEAYDAIKELLLNNTPVTENHRKMQFFDNLYDSLELSKDYFPELLDLAMSYPEYKPYLIEMLAWGYVEDIYEESNFINKADFLKREAMIKLKRTIADQQKSDDDKQNQYYYGSLYDSYHIGLLDYYAIMCGLKKEGIKDIESFFEGIDKVKNKRFKIERQIINHRLDLPVDTATISEVTENLRYRVWAYNRFEKYEMLEYFPDYGQEEISKGILYYTDYDKEKDTIAFVEKHLVKNSKDTGYVYFFKRKKEDDLNWMIDYVGLQPVDQDSVYTYDQTTKKGLAFKTEEEMEKTIEKALDVFRYAYRKRVVVSSGFDWNSFNSLFGGGY